MKESESKMYFGDMRGIAVPQGHEKSNRFMFECGRKAIEVAL